MNRSALRSLLQNLIAASLPLASVACDRDAAVPGPADLAVVQSLDAARPPADLSAEPDLRGAPDLSMDNPKPDLAVARQDLGDCPPLPPPTPCEFDAYAPRPVPANPTMMDCQVVCGDPNAIFCNAVPGAPCNQVHCMTCAIGRRPATLVEPAPSAASDEVGRFFATVAHLEAASIEAFEELARDLRALEAPTALILQAERAADDERRHARSTAEQARRFGGEAVTPTVLPRAARDLEAVALENAVEGCVRETFGALLACWQVRAATDETVREVMGGIAEDETQHAELSWAIARWAEPRLDELARARVAQARRDAARALIAETGVEASPRLRRVAGLPGAAQARFLATRLMAELDVLEVDDLARAADVESGSATA